MHAADRAVQAIAENVAGKRVLEVACGCGAFALAAAKTAAQVDCIDLDASRLLPEVAAEGRVAFRLMDAEDMAYPDGSFDAAVIYNAIGHVAEGLARVIAECRRVAARTIVISSWKMDEVVIEERLLPLLREEGLPFAAETQGAFTIVRI